jgi:hypothetical protein
MRLRSGKRCGSGGVPGGDSLTAAARSSPWPPTGRGAHAGRRRRDRWRRCRSGAPGLRRRTRRGGRGRRCRGRGRRPRGRRSPPSRTRACGLRRDRPPSRCECRRSPHADRPAGRDPRGRTGPVAAADRRAGPPGKSGSRGSRTRTPSSVAALPDLARAGADERTAIPCVAHVELCCQRSRRPSRPCTGRWPMHDLPRFVRARGGAAARTTGGCSCCRKPAMAATYAAAGSSLMPHAP